MSLKYPPDLSYRSLHPILVYVLGFIIILRHFRRSLDFHGCTIWLQQLSYTVILFEFPPIYRKWVWPWDGDIFERYFYFYLHYNSRNRYITNTAERINNPSPHNIPERNVDGANMGPTWVLSAPNGPHVGPMNLVSEIHYFTPHKIA